MERRTVFSSIFKGKSAQKANVSAAFVGGLAPFSGSLDFAAAAHLLRRTGFASTKAQIDKAVEDGLDTTLEAIFSDPPIAELPLNHFYNDDPNVPIGATWIMAPYTAGMQIQQGQARKGSFISWSIGQMVNREDISIREKMVLFWNNHFPIANINDPKFMWTYAETLRKHAMGNFRELTKEITIDPAMLIYLNGNQNVASSPNENFARELLELFTVGKGDLIAPGDYTNYTENDIKEMARILTGWRTRGWYAFDDTQPWAQFVPDFHDTGAKKLSEHFNGVTINDEGKEEYETLINLIFEQPATAKYICTKLYRWFVKSEITEAAENNVITPLAVLLMSHDYEIKPVLEALLSSEHFFSENVRGAMIKNPIELMGSMVKGLNYTFPEALNVRYFHYALVNLIAALTEMRIYDPPSVAGWKAYYQSPLYDKSWLNAVTMTFRMSLGLGVCNPGVNVFNSDTPLRLDPLKLIDTLEEARFVYPMIEAVAALFLPHPLDQSQKEYLKLALIGELDEVEWENEYILYTDNPQNELLAIAVRNRLESMFSALFSMAEIHLM